MSATTALCEALNQGISSGNFIDTKVILYSFRDSSSRVCRPKALYANSHVLKTVPYFKDRRCLAAFDSLGEPHGYRFEVLFGDFAESQLKDFNEAIDEEEIAEDYGYPSDSDFEDDDSEMQFSRAGSEDHHLSLSLATSSEKKIVWEEYEERVEKGKVIRIPDMAFMT